MIEFISAFLPHTQRIPAHLRDVFMEKLIQAYLVHTHQTGSQEILMPVHHIQVRAHKQ